MGVFRQFPYSNFHEMNMDEIIKIVKNMLEEWAQYYAEWDAWMEEINDDWSNYQEVMNEAWQDMQDFINNYFDNLDVQNEINNKITSMVNSGEFANIVEPYIPPRITEWLTANITQPVGVVIDTSLTVAGACADAKATGDALSDKADKGLSSTATSEYLTVVKGSAWDMDVGLPTPLNNRARSNPIKVARQFQKVTVSQGYAMTLYGNNSGQGSSLSVASDFWVYSFDFTNPQYEYYFITIKRNDDADITSDYMDNVLSLFTYSYVPYATEEEVSEIQTELDTKIGFENTEVTTAINRESAGSSVTTALASTRRWFIKNKFSKGSYLEKINFRVIGAYDIREVYVEVWEVTNGTLIKKKTVSTVSNGTGVTEIISATIDYTCESTCMLAILNPVSAVLYTDFNETDYIVYASTDTTLSTVVLNESDLAVWNLIPCATIYYTKVSKVNMVLIGDGMDYEEIQDALNDISDDSVNNPYVLLVMPKGTPYAPFSMVRESFSDTYPWSDIEPRYISIIGVDRKTCAIKSNSGDYRYPCCEPLTNGIIKNLTFVMTNDAQVASATQGGYCLHIDCRTLNDAGYDMTIEDCDFECASGPCLGIGMHENCYLTIRRCNMKTTLQQSYNPHSGYRNLYDFGVVFVHTSTLANAQNQNIAFEDCVGVCNEGDKSLWISSAGSYDPSTAEFIYTLLRNVFWNKTTNTSAYSITNSLTANPMNFGNNNA